MKKRTVVLIVGILLVIVGFTGCSSKTGVINMATKPMTEQYILGSMIKILIEQDTDLTVNITEGVGGGTSNIQPAMERGEFDFYPEYTGSGWNAVLKEESIYDESMFSELQKGYDKMGMTWCGMTGFNNTYGIAVTKEVVEKYNIKNYSDLAAISGDMISLSVKMDTGLCMKRME